MTTTTARDNQRFMLNRTIASYEHGFGIVSGYSLAGNCVRVLATSQRNAFIVIRWAQQFDAIKIHHHSDQYGHSVSATF